MPAPRRSRLTIWVIALVPLALVVPNVLAVWPGRRVSRLRPAEVLRSE